MTCWQRSFRRRRLLGVGLGLCGLLVGLSLPTRAQPAMGPYFESEEALSDGYQLRLSSAIYYATRTDFGEPVVWTGAFLQRIAALEVRSRFDLRLALTPELALQLMAPLAIRRVGMEVDGLLISQTAQLAPVDRTLTGVGVGDPTAALAYRLLRIGPAQVYLEAGARIAIDDSPGGNTLPSRAPPGSGQGWFFLAAGGGWTTGPWAASLEYRFAYAPRVSASYLVRRVSNQAYASGALAHRLRHQLTARAAYRLGSGLSLWLSPALTSTERARVVVAGSGTVGATALFGLALRAGGRIELSDAHTLELFYSQPLLDTWRRDPLFPLELPPQGGGLMWVITGQ